MAVPARAAAPALVDRSTAVLCVVATAGIVLQQELRTPLHLPGHRGLLWLGLLVAVRLATGRPGPALATGAASAGLTAALGLSPDGPLGALPYLLAAGALDGAGMLPGVRGRAWALAALAAPVHLAALLVPASRSLLLGVDPAALAQGLTTAALLHLGFGLGAGLLGLGLAAAWRAAGGPTARSARPG